MTNEKARRVVQAFNDRGPGSLSDLESALLLRAARVLAGEVAPEPPEPSEMPAVLQNYMEYRTPPPGCEWDWAAIRTASLEGAFRTLLLVEMLDVAMTRRPEPTEGEQG